jgi:hypothetical protein
MALKVNYQKQDGTVIENAYVNISSARSLATYTFISVNWWESETARIGSNELPTPQTVNNIPKPIYSEEFIVPTAELLGDFWPAMYQYLKTLPEFSGAVDC